MKTAMKWLSFVLTAAVVITVSVFVGAKSVAAEGNQAEWNGTEYATVAEAYAAAATDALTSEQTITLLSNATVSTTISIAENAKIKIDLQGYTLKAGTSANGNMFKLSGGNMFSIVDTSTEGTGVVDGNKKWRLLYCAENSAPAEIVLTGIKVKDCQRTNVSGGAMNVVANTVLTITGVTFEDCSASNSGGAIYIAAAQDSDAAVNWTVTDSAFIRCAASQAAGALYVNKKVALTAQNTRFEECTAGSSGGALYVNNAASVSMTNCQFSACSATTNGGAINASGTSVTLDNCALTDCYAAKLAGAVHTGSKVTTKNGTTITRCTSGDASTPCAIRAWSFDLSNTTVSGGDGVYYTTGTGLISSGTYTLREGNTMQAAGHLPGASVGTPSITGGSFSTDVSADMMAGYVAITKVKDTGLYVVTRYLSDAITQCQNHGGGEIKICSDFTTTGSMKFVSTDIVLDLNGHTGTFNPAKAESNMFQISGANLTIKDSVGTGVLDANRMGRVLYIETGTVTLKSGTLQNGYRTGASGGNVLLSTGTTFTIDGGTIKDGKIERTSKTTMSGGNIHCNAGSILNINGGTITSGYAGLSETATSLTSAGDSLGGNIYVTAGATVTMTGGTIKDGVVGMYASESPINVKVTGKGGNVYIATDNTNKVAAVFNMSGGEILNGFAKTNTGGNLWIDGKFYMSGGLIADGLASGGGNIFVNIGNSGYEKGIFEMSGGIVRDGNTQSDTGDRTAAVNGRNIAINGGTTYVPGKVILKGNAVVTFSEDQRSGFYGFGGNISCSGYLTISENAEVSYGFTEATGSDPKYGGNIYVSTKDSTVTNPAKLIMTGGVVKNGVNNKNGGGNICISTNSIAEISGGEVKDGFSVGNGYNIYVLGTLNIPEGSTAVIGGKGSYGGKTTANNCVSANDASARINMHGGTITENLQIVSNGAEAVVDGGEIKGSLAPYNGKAIASGNAIINTSSVGAAKGELVITGGYFKTAPTVAAAASDDKLTISGGFFKVAPNNKYLAEGLSVCALEAPVSAGTSFDCFYEIAAGFEVFVSSKTVLLGQQVAPVIGTAGTKKANSVATFTTSTPDGYQFLGWFKNGADTPVETSTTLEVTVTESANYEAIFEWVGSQDASNNIEWNIQGDDGLEFTVNGVKYTGLASGSVPFGSEITVSTEDEAFIGWVNDNMKIMSKESTWTYTVVNSFVLYATKSDDEIPVVAFLNASNQLIGVLSAETSISAGDLPPVPARFGMTGGTWSLTVDQINEKILAGENFIRVIATGYTAASTTQVTIIPMVGGVASEEDKTVVTQQNGYATLTAPATNGEMVFAYFATADGKVLSNSNTFTTTFAADATVYAVYVASTEVEDAKAVVTLTTVSQALQSNGTYTLSVAATRSVPASFEVVEAGILIIDTEDISVGHSLTYDHPAVTVVTSSSKALEGNTLVNIRGLSAGKSITVCGYVIVKSEENGKILTEVLLSEQKTAIMGQN